MPDPWDQLPEESNLWYGRFTIYLRMGTERNVLEVYNRWREAHGRKRVKAAGGSWTGCTIKYKWHDRASAWDDFERQRMEEEHRKEVDDLFRHTLAVTRVAYQKLANRLSGMDPTELEARYVVPQLLTLIQRLEKQFGREVDKPVQVEVMTEEDCQAVRERIDKQIAQRVAAFSCDEDDS